MIRKANFKMSELEDTFEDIVTNIQTKSIIINKEFKFCYPDVLEYQYWYQYALQRRADDITK